MSENTLISRRSLLTVIGGAAAGLAAVVAGPAGRAHAAPSTAPDAGAAATTANGWPVLGTGSGVAESRIEGSDAVVALRGGEVETVLLHVARRFNYEIDTLNRGDLHGHTTATGDQAPYESNYRSGTAFAIRPDLYPVGSAGNLFAPQLLVLRDILADCEGVVRWGGDDQEQPKEGHFQIDVPPGDSRLSKVAAKIRGWQQTPDQGAGAPVDPLARPRLAASRTLAGRQKAAGS
ncbi:hypothetical protein ACFZB9_18445 [Kitasatospora sp. NPDC008050]|uniref:hypothetical protein n=1 Tax=Kitasatospora sp. NPDC008050 TaxID=3364021 RepID=UPI0036E6C8DD